MTPGQLSAAGQSLYGAQWQTALARRLGVDDRTVRRWLAGDRAIPLIAERLIELLRRYPKEA
jgi:DNA-binding transcriptional regulator YiaG